MSDEENFVYYNQLYREQQEIVKVRGMSKLFDVACLRSFLYSV
jgi:hypothetical protein